MHVPDIRKIDVKGKKVFLRADLDAPVKKAKSQEPKAISQITDDTRLVAALKTIEYLQTHGAHIILAGHFGRPDPTNNKEHVPNNELSLNIVAAWLHKRLKSKDERLKNIEINGFTGWKIAENVTLLENLRFYKGEKANDQKFAKQLAALADLYVNDAFAVCHRKNASIVAITNYLPHYAGIHLQEEIQELGGVLEHPKRPLVVIIGGAKIETKLPLVSKMHKIADYVLVGGKIVEEEKKLLLVQHEKLAKKQSMLLVADINDKQSDITHNSVENFLQVIPRAKTIVWNGPMGIIEEENGMAGTQAIAQAIVKSHAHSIVGGGNTIGFLRHIRLAGQFSFLSTGGGAMLSLLSGETLPGIEALR